MPDNDAITEEQLLHLLAQDDAAAFDTLYERHWETLYRTAFYLLHDRAAAMDIVQDIFVWLWEHRREHHIAALRPYLRAAVKFKVANYIRSGHIRDSFFQQLAEVQPPESPLTADQVAATRELETIIRQAIDNLPDKCRSIFQLSRDGRLTNQQIADQLGISVKTVEAQMTIALRRIRAAVEPYHLGLILLLALPR